MVDYRLAEKYAAAGLNLSAGEDAWAAYHLAKDVLELRAVVEAARRYQLNQMAYERNVLFAALSALDEGGRE